MGSLKATLRIQQFSIFGSFGQGLIFLGQTKMGFFSEKIKFRTKIPILLGPATINPNEKFSPILQRFLAKFYPPNFTTLHRLLWTRNLLCPQSRSASRPQRSHRHRPRRMLHFWWPRL